VQNDDFSIDKYHEVIKEIRLTWMIKILEMVYTAKSTMMNKEIIFCISEIQLGIFKAVWNRVVAGDSPSCPQLIANKLDFIIPEECLSAANAADRPIEYKPTLLYQFLNRALKYGIFNRK